MEPAIAVPKGPEIHPTVAAIFDEHFAPQHCTRADVLAVTGPLLEIAAKMRRQSTEYSSLMWAAESSGDLPDELRDKTEFLHQSLGAVDRVVTDFIRCARELTKVAVQLDGILAQAAIDLNVSAPMKML